MTSLHQIPCLGCKIIPLLSKIQNGSVTKCIKMIQIDFKLIFDPMGNGKYVGQNCFFPYSSPYCKAVNSSLFYDYDA